MAKNTREQFADYMHSLLAGEAYVPPEEDGNSTRRKFAEYMDNLFGVNMAQEQDEPEASEPAPPAEPIQSPSCLDPIREEISERTGIPLSLLTGKTSEEIVSNAKALLEFREASGVSAYPVLHDGGEPTNLPLHVDPVEDLRERLNDALAWNPRKERDGWIRIY